jgi:hypothetical protein
MLAQELATIASCSRSRFIIHVLSADSTTGAVTIVIAVVPDQTLAPGGGASVDLRPSSEIAQIVVNFAETSVNGVSQFLSGNVTVDAGQTFSVSGQCYDGSFQSPCPVPPNSPTASHSSNWVLPVVTVLAILVGVGLLFLAYKCTKRSPKAASDMTLAVPKSAAGTPAELDQVNVHTTQ